MTLVKHRLPFRGRCAINDFKFDRFNSVSSPRRETILDMERSIGMRQSVFWQILRMSYPKDNLKPTISKTLSLSFSRVSALFVLIKMLQTFMLIRYQNYSMANYNYLARQPWKVWPFSQASSPFSGTMRPEGKLPKSL